MVPLQQRVRGFREMRLLSEIGSCEILPDSTKHCCHEGELQRAEDGGGCSEKFYRESPCDSPREEHHRPESFIEQEQLRNINVDENGVRSEISMPGNRFSRQATAESND